MAKIVTILNFKGGVGKTTCAVEIAVSLARFYGRRALLIDLDPQASATFYLMEQERWKQWREVHGSTFNLFEQNNHRFYIRNAIVPDVVQGRTAVFGFDLLPSDPNLVDVDLRLSDFIGYTMLQHYLDEIRDLDPADREDIGRKIDESEFATNLVYRIRDVMRRIRLGAPKVSGRGMGERAFAAEVTFFNEFFRVVPRPAA